MKPNARALLGLLGWVGFGLGLGLGLGLLPGGVGGLSGDRPAYASPSPSPRLEGALVQLLRTDRPRQGLLAQRIGVDLDVRRRVRVVVEPLRTTSPARLRGSVEALGGVVEAQSSRFLRARVPLESLAKLAEVPGVRIVRRPYRLRTLEIPRYREGTLPTGGLLFHSYGIRGRGVTVAVIDAGFEGLQEAYREGWLDPAVVVGTIDYSGKGFESRGDHGLRVARLVHEMAPEASLLLLNLGEDGDEVVFEKAVEEAIRRGARVINHSIGWFETNFGDGTGPIDAIVRRARERGVLWVNAAGNQAGAHWMGRAYDRDRDGWVEFRPELEELKVWATFGGVITLVLVWDDFPQTSRDLDLFLLDGEGEVVASAEAPQRGFDPPYEVLEYVVTEPGVYSLKVKRKGRWADPSSLPLRFKVWSFSHTLSPSIPHGSVMAPADCECALAVGAVNAYRWEEDGLEGFSARGPTSDGRLKPDLVAPDGVHGDLFGTSFAAPYVAGAAALLLSRNPDWSVEELERALLANTVDIGPPGPDVESGYGKLRLSLGKPSAVREIPSPTLRPGEETLVKVTVRMPPMRFGALELRESLPPGFGLEPQEADGAQVERLAEGEARWVWPALGPGESRTIVYRLRVPSSAELGLYPLRGELNGLIVTGDDEIQIVAARSSPTATKDRKGIALEVRARRSQLTLRIRGLPSGRCARVRIFDSAGRERFLSGSLCAPGLTIPLARWANGVYFAVVTAPSSTGENPVPKRVVRFAVLR